MLKDLKRIQSEEPKLAPVGDILVSQCAAYCFQWGRSIGATDYEFFFDQGESFYGHAQDRVRVKKSRRDSPIWEHVIHIGESDARRVPALQVADLFAWTLNRAIEENTARYEWQVRLGAIGRDRDILDYDKLSKPLPGAIEKIHAWGMPKRGRMR